MRVVSLAIMLALQTPSQAVNHSIAVQVTDVLGAAISGAEVFVHEDAPANQGGSKFLYQTIATNASGMAHVAAGDGFFDVCVMAPAFTPVCKKIEVRERDVVTRFRMRLDPLIMKRFGDTVE